MSSWQSQILRPLLRAQWLAQRYASIEGTRRLSRASERPGELPGGVTSEIFTQGDLQYEWLTPPEFDADRVLYYLHGGGFVFPLWNPLRRVIAHVISYRFCRGVGGGQFSGHHPTGPTRRRGASATPSGAFLWAV